VKTALRGVIAVALLAASIASLSGCALAGVAASSYHSQLVAAANAKLRSDLADAAIGAAAYAIQNNGSYSGATVAALEANGFSASELPSKFRIVVGVSGTAICMQGTTTFGETSHAIEDGTYSAGACAAA
jgi:hypothetical protein